VLQTVQAQGGGLKQIDLRAPETARRGHAQVGHGRQAQLPGPLDGGGEGVRRQLLVQLDPVGAFRRQGVDGGDRLFGRLGDQQFDAFQR